MLVCNSFVKYKALTENTLRYWHDFNRGDKMTGYTVHTGSSDKFSTGWDNIFGKADSKKKLAKNQKKEKSESKNEKTKSKKNKKKSK